MIFLKNHDEFRDELLRRKRDYDSRLHRRVSLITRSACALLCLCLMVGFLLPGAASPDTPTEPIIQNTTPSTTPTEPSTPDTSPTDPTGASPESPVILNLLSGFIPADTQGKTPDDTFTAAQMDFALKLLQGSYAGDNTLVSPLSATVALSMLANGAGGQTLDQIEEVLCGGASVSDWNEYLKYYVNSLPTTDTVKLLQANSVWYDQNVNLSLNHGFLQTVADYYTAELYAAPFNEATKNAINDWISRNTDGLIENALEKMEGVMCLINALVFDGNWAEPYRETSIYGNIFSAADGSAQTVDMMFSTENLYLESDTAKGFMKLYDGGDYAFVAILPNEELTLTEYLETLTTEELSALLNGATHTDVRAGLPQFECEYTFYLDDILRELGMTDAFDPDLADLSPMTTSMSRDLFVSSVLQKTRITVDAKGTKAAASTIITLEPECEPLAPVTSVILDRPFLYMIVDTQTNLPIFIGTVTDLA